MSAERRGPAICNTSNQGEGKDEMTKASIELQDLRRRIYVKAKAEPSWRFWGLYVHVCKMETLRAAYEVAKQNDGAPGVDGVTFEAIEAQGVEALLERLRDELTGHTYVPLPARKQEIPKDGGKVRVCRGHNAPHAVCLGDCRGRWHEFAIHCLSRLSILSVIVIAYRVVGFRRVAVTRPISIQ